MHLKSLRHTKLTYLIRMGLALVMLALNGNLVRGSVTGECVKRLQFTFLLYVLGWDRSL